jgi:hypothetical protein
VIFPSTAGTLRDPNNFGKDGRTQDRYMTRGRVHTQVADLLDRSVRKSGE